ncbi:hypothetical protein B7494_g3878 [Chlorociboria aeruginascens]|nr:hypothetical protein B7494_g3878 [Chlorociboria aeruginascens]
MSSEPPLTSPILRTNTSSSAAQSPQTDSTVTIPSVHSQNMTSIPRSPATSHPPRDIARTPSALPDRPQTLSILAPLGSLMTDHSTARSSRSTAKITLPPSPSENQSQPNLSPGQASVSSSYFFSSDTGRSLCSIETGPLLSPPLAHPDGDKPPYKPDRQDSDSLTMAKLKRARTEPNNEFIKQRRRRRRHDCNKRKRKLRKSQSRGGWRILGCQVTPTAPFGSKALCGSHDTTYIPRGAVYRSSDSYKKRCIMSSPARPVVSRRWSSVEIGAHYVLSRSKISKGAITSARSLSPNDRAVSSPEGMSYRYRNSTFTGSVLDHDIVRTVRERLTGRKALRTQLETPATITLRRASGLSMQSDVPGNNTDTVTTRNETGKSTPRKSPLLSSQEKSLTEYIITSRDIDSITELIEASIRQHYQPRPRTKDHSPTFTPSTNARTKSLSVTKKGLIIKDSSPPESTITTAEAQRSNTTPQPFSSRFQGVPQTRKRSGLSSGNQSRKSVEVIWEGGIPAEDECLMSIVEDEGSKQSSTSDDSPQQRTPKPKPGVVSNVKPTYSQELRTDASDAFDPKNANASIDEWLWRCPQDQAPVVILSGPGSAEESPKSEASSKEVTKPPETKTDEMEVFSFPSLPARKSTRDWHSPLPDITASPVPPQSRSLYGLGVDACTGSYTSQIASLLPSEPTWLGFSEDPKPTGVNFKVNPDSHRKSVIKAHPNAPIRPGEPISMGSAIGIATGLRRKSSGLSPKMAKHVSTIDNAEKGKRQGIWTKPRQDSSYPSPKPPSPEDDETDNDSSWSTDTSRPQSRARLRPSQVDERGTGLPASTDPSRRSSRAAFLRSSLGEEKKNSFLGPCRPPSRGTALRSGPVDRMALIRDKSPPLPTMDYVGIFSTITGSQVKSDPYLEECSPHICDDCANDPRTPDVDWIG